MCAAVHAVGASATSFPPTETTKTSSPEMWSRRNASCGRSAPNARSSSAVASTAAFKHARLGSAPGSFIQ